MIDDDDDDARFWSSLACFESPDIEGGVKRKVTEKLHDATLSLNEDLEFVSLNQGKSPPKRKTTTNSPPTTSSTESLPIPVFDNLDDDEFASVLNTIFQSA